MAFGDFATLLTDFTGADENPISDGGKWASLDGTTNLQRIGNSLSGSAAAFRGSYWTVSDYGSDVEAYLTISTSSGLNVLLARATNVGASTYNGYAIYFSG